VLRRPEPSYTYRPMAAAVQRVTGGCVILIDLSEDKELMLLLPRAHALAMIDRILDAIGDPDEEIGAS